MTLDWFLLLTPILLLPLLLLLSFAGCSGTPEVDPSLTFVLHDSSLIPAPAVTKVDFQWTVEQDGTDIKQAVYVEEFEVISGDAGEQILEFRYQPATAKPGQVWTVTCLPYSDTIGFGEMSCGPFKLALPVTSVEFEIIPDPPSAGRVQVSPGGCPNI